MKKVFKKPAPPLAIAAIKELIIINLLPTKFLVTDENSFLKAKADPTLELTAKVYPLIKSILV